MRRLPALLAEAWKGLFSQSTPMPVTSIAPMGLEGSGARPMPRPAMAQLLRPGNPRRAPIPVHLVLGPRQVGKHSLLTHCGPDRQRIDLDDLDVCERATRNPELFARDFVPPRIIDEIQFAPQLLSPVKRLADAIGQSGIVWMTGSQNFSVMKGAKETLAGRVATLNLLGLSDDEKAHQALAALLSPALYFNSMLETGFPVFA